MIKTNNAAVGANTRGSLQALVQAGMLDAPSAMLIERALAKHRPSSPCGWTFLLADCLEAKRERALAAASLAEVFSSAVDFIDDVQDGDADRHFGDLSLAVQVNLCAQLVSVAGYLAARFDEETRRVPPAMAVHVPGLLAAMCCGQRVELTREGWSVPTYDRVGRLIGGRQFEVYLRAAAQAAEASVAPLLPLAEPLGVLVQYVCDDASSDSRLQGLPPEELRTMRQSALDEFGRAAQAAPASCRPVIDMLAQFACRPLRSGPLELG
jgi:hypothetical protein